MKPVTREMIHALKINKLGYDEMGYDFNNVNQLSFHHMIIPRRDCKKLHVPSEGYIFENGAILVQSTSHDYLHLIERYDRERFDYITKSLIAINIERQILYNELVKINDCLKGFEREHCSDRVKGNPLIKYEYTRRRERWK